jgi:FkbM family methyltransferase
VKGLRNQMRQLIVRFAKIIFYKLGIRLVRLDLAKERLFPADLELDLMFDVGANTGQYVKLIRNQGFQKQIVSFEPLSIEHEFLKLLAAKDNKWRVFDRCAIGSSSGLATINISENSFSSSLSEILETHVDAAPKSKYIGTENVQVFKLSEIYNANFKNFNRVGLKIDVQGFEMEVLRGAIEILDKIYYIQIELSTVPIYANQNLYHEIDALLREAGFNLWKIIPGFTHPRTGQQLQFDGVYIK